MKRAPLAFGPRFSGGGVVTTYGYDLIDQLTSETKSALSYSATYTYDANGNRLTRTRNGVTENYSYNGADQLTQITGGANPRTFTYDAAGRTTQISAAAGNTTLAYDYDGRVTNISYPNATADSFAYNGSGARVSSSGVNGAKTFRRNGTGVTSPLMSDGTKTYTPGVSSRQSGVTTFQHGGLKNATDQTSSAQAVTASRHYDAFGNLISSTGSWQGVHGYAGSFGYQEDGNGLKLLGHRYYDPDTGRFLSQDPIKDGKNWYAYCGSSPTNLSDSSGLMAGDLDGNTVSVSVWAGSTMLEAAFIRKLYNRHVRGLDPNDSAGRVGARNYYRRIMPEPFRSALPAGATGRAGSANKTNANFDNAGKLVGKAGKALIGAAVIIDGYELATSDNKSRTATEIGFSWAGAWAGGTVGAEIGAGIGSFICPGIGTVVGGIIGGVIGAVAGGNAGRNAGGYYYDNLAVN